MSAHASQAFSIAHCTYSEDLPEIIPCKVGFVQKLYELFATQVQIFIFYHASSE